MEDKKPRFNIGDKAKIDFNVLSTYTNGYVLESIKAFDEEHKSKHRVTGIYIKTPYTEKLYYRYELDNDLVFMDEELIKIKEEN
jgi:hypothetical protein